MKITATKTEDYTERWAYELLQHVYLLAVKSEKSKIKFKDLTYKVKDIISLMEEFEREFPEHAKRIKAKKTGCPFPFECTSYPCGDVGDTFCRADICSNGYAYRMS